MADSLQVCRILFAGYLQVLCIQESTSILFPLLFKFRGLKKRASDGQTDGSMDASKKGLGGYSGNLYLYPMTQMVRLTTAWGRDKRALYEAG